MGPAVGTEVPSRRLRAVRWRLALAFFGLALITRVPFATHNLYAPDSVLYARAIESFDPFEQRPQPPGYLWYVLVLRGLDLIAGDANRAMTIVSAVAGAAAVALVYLLAARLYEERNARVAAIFIMTAVTFWAYGGVAYPYTLLAALSIACAWLLWRALDRESAPERRGLRLAAPVVAVLVAAWYSASALVDGGFARFAEALSVQARFVDERYSIFGNGPF